MKKLFYISILSFLTLFSVAQVSNEVVQDCDNNIQSIYDALGSGKSLLVASQGIDCGICQNRAASLESWAVQNSQQVAVWGAMTNTFSNTTPKCGDLDSWEINYSWSTVFGFIDQNKVWFDQGTPRYYVYNPSDSSLAYNGFSLEIAESLALSLSQNSIGLKEENKKPFTVFTGPNGLELKNLEEGFYSYKLVSLTGRVVKNKELEIIGNTGNIETVDVRGGIYLLNLKNNSGFQSVKRVYIK